MTALPKPSPRPPKVRKRLTRTALLCRKSRPRPQRKGDRAAQLREADRLWSAIIRTGNPKCQKCWQEPTTDSAHVFPRRHMYTRHLLLNGFGLGRKCHQELGSAAVGKDTRMGGFFISVWGEETYRRLEREAQHVGKFDRHVLIRLREFAAKLGIQ
jgi:hypothetical protein